MIFTLDGELHLSDVPAPLLHQLIRELTVPNPRYTNALRLGRPTWNIPQTIMLYEIRGNALTLPRGMAEQVWRQRPAGTVAQDRTLKAEPCRFDLSRFTLRDYQQEAVDAALACRWHQGVLIAPCGAGKTEIGMAVIAHLGRPALWITHTLDLAQQALERARLRLGLDDREGAVISGTHKRCGTKLTIATVQSLYRMELDELAATVGVVIVDECHHVVNNPEQASMFTAVLRCLPASLNLLEALYRYALELGLAAEFVCGATRKADRAAALARMKNGTSRILFATYQLAKEGLDIPRLDRLVLATPTRNKVIVQQSIGRIQRPAPGKTDALVLDIVDEKTPQLLAQYKQRRTLYRKMNMTEKENHHV